MAISRQTMMNALDRFKTIGARAAEQDVDSVIIDYLSKETSGAELVQKFNSMPNYAKAFRKYVHPPAAPVAPAPQALERQDLLAKTAGRYYKGDISKITPERMANLKIQLEGAKRTGNREHMVALQKQSDFGRAYTMLQDPASYQKGGIFENGVKDFLENTKVKGAVVGWIVKLSGASSDDVASMYKYSDPRYADARYAAAPNYAERRDKGTEGTSAGAVLTDAFNAGGRVVSGLKNMALQARASGDRYPGLDYKDIYSASLRRPDSEVPADELILHEVVAGPMDKLARYGGKVISKGGGAAVDFITGKRLQAAGEDVSDAASALRKWGTDVEAVEGGLAGVQAKRASNIKKRVWDDGTTKGAVHDWLVGMSEWGKSTAGRAAIKTKLIPKAAKRGLGDAVERSIVEDLSRIEYAREQGADSRVTVGQEIAGRGIGLGISAAFLGWSKLPAVQNAKIKQIIPGYPPEIQKKIKTTWESAGGVRTYTADSGAPEAFQESLEALTRLTGDQLDDLMRVSGDIDLGELARNLRSNAAEYAKANTGDVATTPVTVNKMNRAIDEFVERMAVKYEEKAIKQGRNVPMAGGVSRQSRETANVADATRAVTLDKSSRVGDNAVAVSLPETGTIGKGISETRAEKFGRVNKDNTSAYNRKVASAQEGVTKAEGAVEQAKEQLVVARRQTPSTDGQLASKYAKEEAEDALNLAKQELKQAKSGLKMAKDNKPEYLDVNSRRTEEELEGMTASGSDVRTERIKQDQAKHTNRELDANETIQSAEKQAATRVGDVLRESEKGLMDAATRNLEGVVDPAVREQLNKQYSDVIELTTDVIKRTGTKTKMPKKQLMDKTTNFINEQVTKMLERKATQKPIDIVTKLGELVEATKKQIDSGLSAPASILKSGDGDVASVFVTKAAKNKDGTAPRVLGKGSLLEGIGDKTVVNLVGPRNKEGSILRENIEQGAAQILAGFREMLEKRGISKVQIDRTIDNIRKDMKLDIESIAPGVKDDIVLSQKSLQQIDDLVKKSMDKTLRKATGSYDKAVATLIRGEMRQAAMDYIEKQGLSATAFLAKQSVKWTDSLMKSMGRKVVLGGVRQTKRLADIDKADNRVGNIRSKEEFLAAPNQLSNMAGE